MSWVKLQLTRGDSGGREWQVDQSAAGARIEVGSAPDCSWVVQAPGVAAKHLEIYWDGEVLWVAKIHGAPDVRCDGLMVDDWYATGRGSSIRFGEAELKVDTGTAPLDGSDVANRDRETAKIAGPEAHPEAKTRMATPAARGESPSLPDGPTAILAAPQPHISNAATQIVKPNAGGAAPPADDAAGRIAAFEAQMRGQQEGGGGGGDPGPLPSGQATQLVSLPEAQGQSAPAPGRRPPPPRIGQNVSRVEREPTPAPPAPTPAVTPDTPSVIVGSQEASQPSQPSAPSSPDQSGPAPAAGTPFAAPPVDDPKARRQRRREKRKAEGTTSLPIRTWVLLVATVGALVFVLFMDDGNEESMPPPPDPDQGAQTENGTETENGDETETGETETGETETENENGDETETAETETETETETATETETGETDEDPDEQALIRQAVDALVANRQREAYRLYSRLAEAHPDETSFSAIRDILRRRLQASCVDGVDPQGNPCEQIE